MTACFLDGIQLLVRLLNRNIKFCIVKKKIGKKNRFYSSPVLIFCFMLSNWSCVNVQVLSSSPIVTPPSVISTLGQQPFSPQRYTFMVFSTIVNSSGYISIIPSYNLFISSLVKRMMPVCDYCKKEIKDTAVRRDGKHWHRDCFRKMLHKQGC